LIFAVLKALGFTRKRN